MLFGLYAACGVPTPDDVVLDSDCLGSITRNESSLWSRGPQSTIGRPSNSDDGMYEDVLLYGDPCDGSGSMVLVVVRLSCSKDRKG